MPALPFPAAAKRPLVSFAVGTQGLGDQCAPSRQMVAGTETEAGVIQGLLLQGMGGCGHRLRGARHARPAHLCRRTQLGPRRPRRRPGRPSGCRVRVVADTPVAIWGYSEGGAASSWAADSRGPATPRAPFAWCRHRWGAGRHRRHGQEPRRRALLRLRHGRVDGSGGGPPRPEPVQVPEPGRPDLGRGPPERLLA